MTQGPPLAQHACAYAYEQPLRCADTPPGGQMGAAGRTLRCLKFPTLRCSAVLTAVVAAHPPPLHGCDARWRRHAAAGRRRGRRRRPDQPPHNARHPGPAGAGQRSAPAACPALLAHAAFTQQPQLSLPLCHLAMEARQANLPRAGPSNACRCCPRATRRAIAPRNCCARRCRSCASRSWPPCLSWRRCPC